MNTESYYFTTRKDARAFKASQAKEANATSPVRTNDGWLVTLSPVSPTDALINILRHMDNRISSLEANEQQENKNNALLIEVLGQFKARIEALEAK